MDIVHNEEKKCFDMYAESGTKIGEIEYMYGGNNELYVTHTEVFPGNEGKGYGTRLLDALAAYAEEKDAKLVPICPYVKAMFQRFPEKYASVIKR